MISKYFSVVLILLAAQVSALTEADYVNDNCKGQIEYTLPDLTRVDCLTETHAIEYDYDYKWAEAIGQSLYYASQTGKKAGIVLICRNNNNCQRYIDRINAVLLAYNLSIDIWIVSKTRIPLE